MMRFTHAERLNVPCRFERYVEGELHPDGRRYLPLLIFGLTQLPGCIAQIGVVDRHHRVRPELVGQHGTARLVLLLSSLRLIETPRQGLFDPNQMPNHTSTMPEAYGQVVEVPTWELGSDNLPYETLYTEILLDIGIGVVGIRTSATGADLAAQIGKQQLEPGDWIQVVRSRVDILEFLPYD